MLNDGTFVMDAVAHSVNLTEVNLAHRAHAQAMTDMIYGVVSAVPEGYVLSEQTLKRDWAIEDTAATLFHESETQEQKANILGRSFARLNGLGLDAMQSALEGAEFSADGEAVLYLTTTVADKVLAAA